MMTGPGKDSTRSFSCFLSLRVTISASRMSKLIALSCIGFDFDVIVNFPQTVQPVSSKLLMDISLHQSEMILCISGNVGEHGGKGSTKFMDFLEVDVVSLDVE